MELSESEHARNLVASVVQLAHTLGLEPLAEGVETEEQRRFLVEHGCRYGQGFLFSRPLPTEELKAFYDREQGTTATSRRPATPASTRELRNSVACSPSPTDCEHGASRSSTCSIIVANFAVSALATQRSRTCATRSFDGLASVSLHGQPQLPSGPSSGGSAGSRRCSRTGARTALGSCTSTAVGGRRGSSASGLASHARRADRPEQVGDDGSALGLALLGARAGDARRRELERRRLGAIWLGRARRPTSIL